MEKWIICIQILTCCNFTGKSSRDTNVSKNIHFGVFNLHYNIDAFWKNGSFASFTSEHQKCGFFEKVHLNILKWIKTDNLVHLEKRTDNFVHIQKKYAHFLRNGGTSVPGLPAQAPFRKKWVRVGRDQNALVHPQLQYLHGAQSYFEYNRTPPNLTVN